MFRYGDGNEGLILDADVGDGSPNPSFVVSDFHDMRPFNMTSAQLIAGGIPVQVAVTSGDDVDGATGVWTIDALNFTTYVGGYLIAEGMAEPENNGTFPITAGGDGTVTVGESLSFHEPVDETVPDTAYIYAVPPNTLKGTWKVEVSNNFVPANGGTSYGQPPQYGKWTDITSQYSPAIAAVDTAAPTSYSQYTQAELAGRTIRYSFTRTAGDGHVMAIVFSKSNG